MGTAGFLIGMTVFVAAWILWNVLAPVGLRFDEFPFIFLTLMLSLQASYAAPLILLAQNRQADRDRVALEQDRARDERNLADTEFLTREVASLRIALREQATRDFVRSELRNLLDELEDRADRPRAATRRTTHELEQASRGCTGRTRGPRPGAPVRSRIRWRTCLSPHCPAVTPCSRRCRRSTTPRSASRSPSSAWSSRSRSTTPARSTSRSS